jgi:tRNA threonylcarbamoyladenosine biosynthesis protein TsaE
MRVLTGDADATRALGRRLGELAVPGTAVALSGELGAGKTVFAKGIGEGLGTPTRITSPTFILVALHEEGRLPLWHADLYRIGGDAAELGLEEAVEGVLVVEWAERAPDVLPDDHLAIHLAHEPGQPASRRITLTATGERHRALLARLAEGEGPDVP